VHVRFCRSQPEPAEGAGRAALFGKAQAHREVRPEHIRQAQGACVSALAGFSRFSAHGTASPLSASYALSLALRAIALKLLIFVSFVGCVSGQSLLRTYILSLRSPPLAHILLIRHLHILVTVLVIIPN
jgi:hypothetical protein